MTSFELVKFHPWFMPHCSVEHIERLQKRSLISDQLHLTAHVLATFVNPGVQSRNFVADTAATKGCVLNMSSPRLRVITCRRQEHLNTSSSWGPFVGRLVSRSPSPERCVVSAIGCTHHTVTHYKVTTSICNAEEKCVGELDTIGRCRTRAR